jgi:hypothetical protein
MQSITLIIYEKYVLINKQSWRDDDDQFLFSFLFLYIYTLF